MNPIVNEPGLPAGCGQLGRALVPHERLRLQLGAEQEDARSCFSRVAAGR
jgi:hypothetical protein